jgi:N-methylhydantoinase A
MRFAVDTGGTFTDLVIEDNSGRLRMFKTPTTPRDPVEGILEAVRVAAESMSMTAGELLGRAELFIHGTTHATNAVITGNTARTAFLTTKGHPDILLFREGGRIEPFNSSVQFPKPYIPRALTFEIPERINSDGTVIEPLDEEAVLEIIGRLKKLAVESVAVCLLWSTVNPDHENRVGDLLRKNLPEVPFSLSHLLNPILREYRRASSACIDRIPGPTPDAYF